MLPALLESTKPGRAVVRVRIDDRNPGELRDAFEDERERRRVRRGDADHLRLQAEAKFPDANEPSALRQES